MPPPRLSHVSEDVNVTITYLTGGEIVAERRIVGLLPVDNQSRGNIIEIAIEFLSEIRLRFVTTTIPLIASFDVANVTHLTDESIDRFITDRFTTANVLFIVGDKVRLIILIDKLKHVIKSIVFFHQLIDLVESINVQNFDVVRGESDGHLVCLVDSVSMAPHGGVWEDWWTVPELSHAVQEVMQGFGILCLSLKDSPMDSTGVLVTGGRCLAGLASLSDDLSGVRVVCFHAVILQGQGAGCGRQWTVCQLAQRSG